MRSNLLGTFFTGHAGYAPKRKPRNALRVKSYSVVKIACVSKSTILVNPGVQQGLGTLHRIPRILRRTPGNSTNSSHTRSLPSYTRSQLIPCTPGVHQFLAHPELHQFLAHPESSIASTEAAVPNSSISTRGAKQREYMLQ